MNWKKKSVVGLISRLDEQKKRGVTWKTGQWNSHDEGGKSNKQGEDGIRALGHNKVDQYTQAKGPKRRIEKGVEGLFKETVFENIPNLGKDLDILTQESQSFK